MGSMGLASNVGKERLTIMLRIFGHGQALVDQLWHGMNELLGGMIIGIRNTWFVCSRKWGRIRRFWGGTWSKGMIHSSMVLPEGAMSMGAGCRHLNGGCCVFGVGISHMVGRLVASLA